MYGLTASGGLLQVRCHAEKPGTAPASNKEGNKEGIIEKLDKKSREIIPVDIKVMGMENKITITVKNDWFMQKYNYCLLVTYQNDGILTRLDTENNEHQASNTGFFSTRPEIIIEKNHRHGQSLLYATHCMNCRGQKT